MVLANKCFDRFISKFYICKFHLCITCFSKPTPKTCEKGQGRERKRESGWWALRKDSSGPPCISLGQLVNPKTRPNNNKDGWNKTFVCLQVHYFTGMGLTV